MVSTVRRPCKALCGGRGRGVNSEQNAKVKPSAWAALKCRTGICSTGICRTKCRAGKCRTGLVSLLVLHFRSCIFSHPVPHIQHTIKQPRQREIKQTVLPAFVRSADGLTFYTAEKCNDSTFGSKRNKKFVSRTIFCACMRHVVFWLAFRLS